MFLIALTKPKPSPVKPPGRPSVVPREAPPKKPIERYLAGHNLHGRKGRMLDNG